MYKRRERYAINSPFVQGESESIARILSIPSSWGTSPFTGLSCTIYAEDIDVTAAHTSGAISSNGSLIKTPKIHSLEVDVTYTVCVAFTTTEGNTLEAVFELRGE